MVLSENTTAHHISIFTDLTSVDIDHVQYTCCACLDCDPTRLIEFIGKDIFIVGQCDNKLDNKLPVPRDDSAPGTPVGMLPSNSIVLFVETNHIRKGLGGAVFPGDNGVEIFNDPETVTAQ